VHDSRRRRRDSGSDVEHVALIGAEPQGHREGEEHLGRWVVRPALLELCEVIDGDAGQRCELLAAQTSCPAPATTGEPHLLWMQAVAPRPQRGGEFGTFWHGSIMLLYCSRLLLARLVLLLPG
jgi:hypothetical protein